MKKSRRDFLKVAGISAAGLSAVALGSATLTQAAQIGQSAQTAEEIARNGGIPTVNGSYETTPGSLTATRWAMVIDTRKLTTREAVNKIVTACNREHNVPEIPDARHAVKWIWNDTYAHGFTDDTNPYLPDAVTYGNFPLLCNHCENPPCVRVCPTGATFKQEDGIVVMDPHRCIGCRFCMAGCPYGSRSFNFRDPLPFIADVNPAYPPRTRGVVEKCTFCPERLAAGKLPACVEASDGAILFGDLNDPDSTVRKALAQNFTVRRKPTLGTGPGVYYII